jgi:hypothetical protein
MSIARQILEKYINTDEKLHKKAQRLANANLEVQQSPDNINKIEKTNKIKSQFWKAWGDSRMRYHKNGRDAVSTSITYYDPNDAGEIKDPTKEDIKRERQKGSRVNRGF